MAENKALMRLDTTLVERCIEHDFSLKIHDIEYCRLNMSSVKRVDCDYLSDKPDHNGLLPCLLTVYFNTNNPIGGDYYMGKGKKKC